MSSVLQGYIAGTVDPTVTATYGEIGWLYIRVGGTGPNVYQKITTDAQDTNWQVTSGFVLNPGTQNFIPYYDVAGTNFSSEAAFNYDPTNNFLGVNQATPKATIHANPNTTSGTVGANAIIVGTPHATANIGAGSLLAGGNGAGNSITGANSFVIGATNVVSGANSIAGGSTCTASGANTLVSGSGSTAAGDRSTAHGNANTVSGVNGLAAGNSNTIQAGQQNAVASGLSNQIIGNGLNNAVFGTLNTIDAVNNCLVVGSGNNVTASETFVSGFQNIISGQNCIIGGQSNIISGATNLVAGASNQATGGRNVLAGFTNNIGPAENSLVAGANNTVTLGGNQIVCGDTNTIVDGANNIVSGNGNSVTGARSIVSGTNNILNFSDNSIVGGSSNTAGLHNQVLLVGNTLVSQRNASAVVGQFNDTDTDGQFIVGIGANGGALANGFVVGNSGLIKMTAGGLLVKNRVVSASGNIIANTDKNVLMDTVGETHTLPAAVDGQEFYLKDITGDPDPDLTIALSGADTFEGGATTYEIHVPYRCVKVLAQAGVWYFMAIS